MMGSIFYYRLLTMCQYLCLVYTFRSLYLNRISIHQNKLYSTVSLMPPSVETSVSNSLVTNDYDESSITVLEGLQPVRKRPGMYIGSTGTRGLHHLVYEIVDNSVDESLAGYCTEITIILNNDGSIEVSDNGRGIPCSVHPTTGKSTLETVLCVLHAGGKFGGEESGYKVSGGLHGVGISVVNALSEKLVVEVHRGDGNKFSMSFAEGTPTSDLITSAASDSKQRGTKVIFKPDPKIFKTTLDFDYDRLASRFDELAYLNAGLVLKFIDKRSKTSRKSSFSVMSTSNSDDDLYLNDRAVSDAAASAAISTANSVGKVKKNSNGKNGKKGNTGKLTKTPIINDEQMFTSAAKKTDNEVVATDDITTSTAAGENMAPRIEIYQHAGGIVEMVKNLCSDKSNLHPEVDVISFSETRNGVTISVALRWSADLYTDSMVGFANNIRTTDGGSHLDGLKSAVTRTINNIARKNGKLKEGSANIPGEFIREGLTAVVSVKVPDPEFEGQTKTRLGNPEIRQLVDSAASDALTTLFEWNPSVLSAVTAKAIEAQNAALAAKAARDMVRRKTLLTNTVLPGKLADCSSRMPAECEIYVVEGDSAAGSAKQGRDRRTQAILPLRGKILNIERASNEKIYSNSELQALISALGLGIRGIEFDSEQLRYHKVIIMTDADVDGAHIRLLLLTFFYRYQRDLIEKGYVFVACPPLYKVTVKGGKSFGINAENYLYDQGAFDNFMKVLPADCSTQIQRFKGLGEMMPNQLWETTMDPAKRILKLVSVDDAAVADKMFSVLMGDNVVPRKEFITLNAEYLKLEDLDF